ADMSLAFALRTSNVAGPARTTAVASSADLIPRDVHLRLRAADGLPEVDTHHIFEIGALFRLGFSALAAAEKLREDVAEAAAALLGAPGVSRSTAAGVVGEIEAAEIELRSAPGVARGRRSGEARIG